MFKADVGLRSFQDLNIFFISSSGVQIALAALVAMLFFKSLIFGWHASDFFLLLMLVSSRSLFEWFLHRYIWHAHPLPIVGLRLGTFVSRMHADHHKNPCDVKSALFGARAHFLAATFGAIFWVSVLGPARGLTVAAAFVLMTLCYEWFHLLAHSGVLCDGYWLRRLSDHHKRHHRDGAGARQAFGVSSMFADKLFKTL